MDRRTFLIGLLTVALLTTKVSTAENINSNNRHHKFAFYREVSATRVEGDVWLLRGQLRILGDHRTSKHPVTLEIATGREFSQIVSSISLDAERTTGYVISHRFASKWPDTQLYFRFQTLRPEHRIGDRKFPEEVIYSAVGEITPWH